ncbi:MAG: HD domain-containing protein [Chlamydiae bacterium]|nr:HD domain-containing protein [Chlamydiota bacterium]
MSVYKKIFDPVHGFIKLDEIEALLVDSHVFQRLHYIRQLGVTYLVYPGATHTRFEHSLGVMEVATQIYDQIATKQLESEGESDYWRQIVRLAALCHDLGHLPFSHLGEKRLLGKGGHEKWTLKVLESSLLDPVWEKLKEKYPTKEPRCDVIKVALGEEKLKEISHPLSEKPFSDREKVMTQVITGDFFGADRIDYLLRDSKCTGLSYGLFDYHQLIEMLRILPDKANNKLVLGIEENGIESCEALLLARHFMHKRVYQYPSVKAYSFHMSRFMKYRYDELKPLENLSDYLSMTDSNILVAAESEFSKGALSHEDAKGLFDRSRRFLSLELPEYIDEEQMQKFAASQAILEGDIEWHIENKAIERKVSFPVLKKNAEIVDATECSKLLVTPFSVSWVYIKSAHAEALREFLSASKREMGASLS